MTRKRNRFVQCPVLPFLTAAFIFMCCNGKEASRDGGDDGDYTGDVGEEAGEDGGPDEMEGGEDVPDSPDEDVRPCIEPRRGLAIDGDVTLCPGTYAIEVAPLEAAVTIEASGVTVTCEGTVIEGTGGFGTTAEPTVGIRARGQADVAVRGCTVRSFRYGFVAEETANTILEEMHLDENFTDPDAGWVQDTVQGGGIRFDRVRGGRVALSTFARNWNGIELRGSENVVVSGNVADHCSNTGATLASSVSNELSDNDFSWGIRGDGLDFPDSWYGIDTRDSAGIIIDAGSSGNRILRNDCRYGGDGIFIRAVIGSCATDNLVEGNDASSSPHNAIECWCDGNVFEGNTADRSHYGLWLGGTDRGVVRGNLVRENVIDGISIQIGENRHTLIEDNVISGNGRAGLLVTGRQYQAWHSLDYWDPSLANSSHVVVQGNSFGGNGRWDVFATSTRSLVLASNCGEGGGDPSVSAGREVEVFEVAGSCGAGEGRLPPAADLSAPTSVEIGAEAIFDASGSTPYETGDSLSFTWLVQPSGQRFASGSLPPMVLGGEGAALEIVTFTSPGLFDADVTVDDGRLAGIAWRQVAVTPLGVRVGEEAGEWDYSCEAHPSCTTVITGEAGGIEGDMIHIVTDAPYDFAAISPATLDLGLDASLRQYLGFFVRARNDNEYGWQGNYPVVVLASSSGTIRYEPDANLLPTHPDEWTFIEVPLAGGEGWARTLDGGTLERVDWIELHSDTWGWAPVDIWIDAMAFF